MREDKIQRISKIFSALGNDIRVKILLLVSETRKPLHIKAVAKALNMDYAALYRHVKVLQRSGLLEIFEVGRSRVLSLKNSEMLKQLIEIANKML
ncbi:MAG: ArsR/SmtB family transcription factor [Candidatus Hodarchaeota archaeon]